MNNINDLNSATLDFFWRRGDLSYLFPLNLGKYSVEKKNIIKANWLALNGEVEVAVDILTEVLCKNKSSREAVISLGAILSQLDGDFYCKVLKRFDEERLLSFNSYFIEKNFQLFCLICELVICCDPVYIKKYINSYFDFFWKNERLDESDNEPMLYWHIPKTGGTSLNSLVSKSYYRSGLSYVPSYTTPNFFYYILHNNDGLFSYISSSHLNTKYVSPNLVESYRKILVLRDPKYRALSAWRQYKENPFKRLLILPQHGFVWNFFPALDFQDWLKLVPQEVKNPLSWTLEEYVKTSTLRKGVDEVVKIENLSSYIKYINKDKKIDSYKVKKNVTNKSIFPISNEELTFIPYLKTDLELFDTFNNF